MKRVNAYLSVLLSLLLLCSLSACGTERRIRLQEGKLNVICTIFPAYDFAREIAGERANVILLMPPGAESHSYEPSPQDMAALIRCDLIVANGGVDESWLEKLIDGGEIHAPVLRMLDCVELYEEETKEGMQTVPHAHDHGDDEHEAHEHDENCEHEHEAHKHDENCEHEHEAHEHDENCELEHEAHEHDENCELEHEAHEHDENCEPEHEAHEHDESCELEHEAHDHDGHGHEHEYDEHVWTSPMNAAIISREIGSMLSAADEANRPYYERQTEAYCEKLLALDSRFRALTENAPQKLMVFADRFPVRYFVEEYGLEYYAAFPGCAEDAEPSARTVAFLIDRVREYGIPAVYYIEFSNEKMADIIVEDTGCIKLPFHSCHNVSAQELSEGISYLQLMEQNYESLKGGLGQWRS